MGTKKQHAQQVGFRCRFTPTGITEGNPLLQHEASKAFSFCKRWEIKKAEALKAFPFSLQDSPTGIIADKPFYLLFTHFIHTLSILYQ